MTHTLTRRVDGFVVISLLFAPRCSFRDFLENLSPHAGRNRIHGVLYAFLL